MSAWYSSIVNTTTSKISNLLNSEADGDTEDDTYVCRILRSYYTEKGGSFPAWLPPDPKAPQPVTPIYSQPNQVGSRYGGLAQQPQNGGLSSLWDSNPTPPPQDAQSLRRGRGNPPPMRSNVDLRNSQSRNSDPMAGHADVQARPLPSQRLGSHQNASYGRDTGSVPPANAGGGSAQDRLKQRLWGGSRTTSPSSTGGPFTPPPQNGAGAYGRPGGLPSGPRMR